MNRLKTSLIDRHIGALVTGLLLFTATNLFLKLLTAPVNTWYGNLLMSRRPQQMFETHTPSAIFDPIGYALALLDIVVYLGAALLLIKWLYIPKTEINNLPEDEEPPIS